MSTKILKGGYTTGACAAAGVKAALFFLRTGEILKSVELTALDGTILKNRLKILAKKFLSKL